MEESYWNLFLIIAGLFTLIAAQSNWKLFWNNSRAKGMIWICRGKIGARVVYSIIGVVFSVIGFSGLINT